MVPGSAVWSQDKHRFIAKTKDGKNLVVETELTNGVPVTAYILADNGQKYEKIQFKYSPGFYDGQLPIEFTGYYLKSGLMTAHLNDQKIYTIRVKALEISDDALDRALMDPAKLAGNHATIIYSNNIAYERMPKGNLRRILTQAEEFKNIEAMKKAGN